MEEVRDVETQSESDVLRLQVRHIYEAIPALVHAINPDGFIELVSDCWLEHFGYEREEVVGRRSTEFLDEDSRRRAVEEYLPRFFAEGRCDDLSYTWICKDGSTRDVLLSATFEKDETGKYVRSLAVLRDVTFLRATELRADHESAVLAQVFESASDAFVLADPTRRITRLNRAAEKLFGCTTEEVAGQLTQIFYANEADYDKQAEITDSVNAYRMEYRRRDGTTFVGDTVGDAIYNEAGQIISLLGVIRDVTTEAQRQADLESSNRQLEISLETLDQFAYIASHDLRTPLRGIMHVVFFLEADTPPELLPAIQPRLTQLRERTLWMDEMLEGLLLFARKGHLSIDREDTDLSTVLDSIETTIRMGESSKCCLVLERDFSQLPGTSVRTNPVALHHILSNLISNALTHHDGDTAKVVVECDIRPEGTRIRVTDDGPGIAPRHQERAFDIFRTLAAKGEDSGSGSGMGLALVRKLAYRIGGSVRLESPVRDDRGCCFEVLLPAGDIEL